MKNYTQGVYVHTTITFNQILVVILLITSVVISIVFWNHDDVARAENVNTDKTLEELRAQNIAQRDELAYYKEKERTMILNDVALIDSQANDFQASQNIREVTAYNAGDPNQTDDTPCIGAYGDDICAMLERGEQVCASNAYPKGTRLYIQNFGECVVLDRMNARYQNRIDIAMKLSEKTRAINFGTQNLGVAVVK